MSGSWTLIIGVVFAIAIAVIIPPLGLLLLLRLVFGLVILVFLMIVFEPSSVTRITSVWMATGSAENISEKFSLSRGC